MGKNESDSSDREPPNTYECGSCGHRLEAESHPQNCPECGGAMQDISVPRE